MDLLRETWVLIKRRLGMILFVAVWLAIAFAPLFLAIAYLPGSLPVAIACFAWIGGVLLVGGAVMDARDVVKDRHREPWN